MGLSYMVLPFDFEKNGIDGLLDILKDLSVNEINFYDETWICDKKANNIAVDSAESYSIYFKNTPNKYNEWIRYYGLAIMSTGGRMRTVSRNIADFKTFLQFLEKYYNSIPLEDVNITEINRYKTYLNSTSYSEDTKHGKWSAMSNFYIKMKGANGFFNENIIPKNTFEKKRSNNAKYIPKFIANQLDDLLQNESIPLEMRTAYWIMRFIPSRISEIHKLPINCIKKTKNGWTITLYMWKQNGGYYEPELRVLSFKNTSKECNYLYNLIVEQQKAAKRIQKKLPKEKQGFLFTHSKKLLDIKLKKEANKIKYKECKNIIVVASENSITNFFKNVCKYFDIKDENGKLYHISSHMLRHNGITDRIYEGNFEVDDIAGITHHKNGAMIFANYTHPTKENILEIQEKVLQANQKLEKKESKPVYFKGKIMNINDGLEKRLLRDIRKHKLKLGICSDFGECKNAYRCLEDCEYYVPDCDDLHYFENEIEQWNRKIEFYNKQNQTIKQEKAEYNLQIHIKVRDRILATIGGQNNG